MSYWEGTHVAATWLLSMFILCAVICAVCVIGSMILNRYFGSFAKKLRKKFFEEEE